MSSIYRPQVKDPEPSLLAQNPGSNGLKTAADPQGSPRFHRKIWAVEPRFSVGIFLLGGYPRGLLDSSLGARISLDLEFKSLAYLNLEFNHFNYC